MRFFFPFPRVSKKRKEDEPTTVSNKPQSSSTLLNHFKIKNVGIGEVCEPQHQVVHGNVIKDFEVYVLVKEIWKDELSHPSYGYPVERNRFTVWDKCNIR